MVGAYGVAVCAITLAAPPVAMLSEVVGVPGAETKAIGPDVTPTSPLMALVGVKGMPPAQLFSAGFVVIEFVAGDCDIDDEDDED